MFGFEINRVHAKANFTKFNFKLAAQVIKQKVKLPFNSVLSLKEEKDIIQSNLFYIDHHLFLRQSPLATVTRELKKNSLSLANYDSLFNYLTEMNTYTHKLLKYKKNVTTVSTTATEALKLKCGVCQDYAHIFIAFARANRIPARYVSGYLNQGKKFFGSSFMHAWVEAFIPDLGWIGFDPTNNLLVDENYIKVSHGADYLDCTPIKGVLKSLGQESKSDYQVKVIQQ